MPHQTFQEIYACGGWDRPSVAGYDQQWPSYAQVSILEVQETIFKEGHNYGHNYRKPTVEGKPRTLSDEMASRMERRVTENEESNMGITLSGLKEQACLVWSQWSEVLKIHKGYDVETSSGIDASTRRQRSSPSHDEMSQRKRFRAYGKLHDFITTHTDYLCSMVLAD